MKKSLMAFPAAIAMGVVAACSGGGGGGGNGGSGTGTVTGTFSGSPVTVRSAITSTIDVGGGDTIQMIILADASNLCATFAAGYQPKSVQGVIFQVANLSAGTFNATAPTAPRTFHLWDTSVAPTDLAAAMFEYRLSDANCNQIAGVSSTSGTITISAISGGTFMGSATLLTEDGDSISATFTAPYCAAMEGIITAPTEPPCQP